MKSLTRSAALLLSLVLSLGLANATTPMGDSMKKMEEACKQLGPDLNQTDDTKHNKDLDLQSVATIKAECLKSHDLVPKKVNTLPADQQATMTSDYQKSMDTFIQHTDALTQDIQSENWAAARTDFKSLMQEQHSDHKLYRIK